MTKRLISVRKITADKKERLNRLAEILYDFIPLTSHFRNAVTFHSIFKESSVGHYLKGANNKRQILQKGFELLYRYHKNLPKNIIRKIIPAAIEYRKYSRKPLTNKELYELATCLEDLGISMTNEIEQIEVEETLPRIIVPPEKLIERLRGHDLDLALSTEPLFLFSNGHFNESVRKASERFEDLVQELSQIDSSGRDLMAKAFNNDLLIELSGVEKENQQGFIEGYRFLTMGTMAAIRNIFSHGDEQNRSPEECFEMLLFINWLFRSIKSPQ